MKQQHITFFLYTLLVGAVCLLMVQSTTSTDWLIIGALLLACLLGAWLIFTLTARLPWFAMLLLIGAFAVSMSFGEGMYPFGCVLIVLAAHHVADPSSRLFLCSVSFLLFGLILWPPMVAILVMLLCTVPLFFLYDVFMRLAQSHHALEEKADENNRLHLQLADQRTMGQAMEHAARLSERNRLAARIHDEVGHGISGSIMLLEGARLTLDKHPDQAKDAIEIATQNLRSSVDDIRSALRSERAKPSEAGLAQISAILTRFTAQHPTIHTSLTTEGELSDIPLPLWICLQENLTETLTNLLKHSNAKNFTASIAIQKKLVVVTFQDDGIAGEYKPGMGLAAIEERCALCQGRCFFRASHRGFSTVMTFSSTARSVDNTEGDAI